jgi:hypothetical protein
MKSKLVDAIGLHTHAVALTWADEAPEDAIRFEPGKWGCVVSVFTAVAVKGRVGAFDRDTYGCWGGGVGLGFGNCYETFPGGVNGFCHFLAQGNNSSEEGRKAGEEVAAWGDPPFTDYFLNGQRYLKTADVSRSFLAAMPMQQIPARYVLLKPLLQVDPEREAVKNVTLFVDSDQLSALVVLANYTEADREKVAVRWGAACQVMGIFAYQELEREHPRALLGMTDISARVRTRESIGRDVLGFTIPWPLFLHMEENVEDSFLQRRAWRQLQRQQTPVGA